MGVLDGKVAIVTGAGRGIGRSEALLLASEGARVVVNDTGVADDGSGTCSSPARRVVDEIVAAGGEACPNTSDVSNWAAACELVEQAVDTFGCLDILVNNAGIIRDRMSFNMCEEEFDDVLRVHLKGHFAPTRWSIAYWRRRYKEGRPCSGRVINTCSEAGLYGTPGQVNYAAAKGGIYSMTMTLARETRALGVTVNAIAPRARTRMTEKLGGAFSVPPTDAFDDLHPDNIAPVVGWLSSDAAADISGQVFVVTGGRVHLLDVSRPVRELRKEGRWSICDLITAQAGLFVGRISDTPEFGLHE